MAIETLFGLSVMVVEPEIGIERRIPMKLIRIPMELVGPGLGHDIDNVAGAPPVSGGKGIVRFKPASQKTSIQLTSEYCDGSP
jgi:hypothetical protein